MAMIVRLSLFTVLFLLKSLVLAADVPSRVEAVTVYPAGAIVTRVAAVDLVAGENEIRLVGLVPSVDDDYLQAEIADARVKIGQIRLSTEQQRDSFNAEITSVIGEIDAMTDRIKAIDDSSNAARLRLKFLDGLAQGYATDAWREGSGGTASIDSLRAALELLQSGSEDANQLIRSNDFTKAALGKDLSVLQRTLAGLRGASLGTVAAELTLTVDRAISTEVRLRYFQGEAYWSPSYESRLDSNTGRLELAQQAVVSQQTDEAWSNVALTLSTSEPTGELAAPELESEFLNIAQPQVRQASNLTMERAAQRSAAADYEMVENIVVTGARRRANVGNFAVNYEIPGLTSVSNDSDEGITLDLARDNFNTELVSQIVPRESTQAFLAARFTYAKSLPLYGSEMMVFVDGVFSGVTEMPTVLPNAQVLLPMGQDRRIEVKSETQGGEGGQQGIISKRKTEATDYVFEITNRRDKPSYVEVRDLVPVARNRDINVEVPRSATPPDLKDIEDQPGLIQWNRTLQPGETWRIRHQYTVSYPADWVLIRE
jgi:uncharacterized protein (TIGR02231 family)